jgi:16S rRNA (guanine966-N2)-methyltransferase
MTRPKRPAKGRHSSSVNVAAAATGTTLRIIGGTHRGRKLLYSGDPRTRPMKDRVREAVFNLLGPEVKGTHTIDLFAGTGALGFEALSRGATRATFFEQHFPTADIIRENAKTLGLAEACEVLPGNTLIQFRREDPVKSGGRNEPWLVFCAPPYDFYVDRRDEMVSFLSRVISLSPANSVIVVEADGRFDFGLLPDADAWDIRDYTPAIIAILRR